MLGTQPFTILNVALKSGPLLMAGRTVRSAGFNVMDASSCEQAIQLLAKHPDIILLPVGFEEIDGLGVCYRIKSQPGTSRIPIVCILPESAGSEWRERAMEFCGDAFLTSPVNTGELLQTVQTLLLKTAKWQSKSNLARAQQTTLLCIDDSTEGLEVRRGILENSGYTVLTAKTGLAGIETFSQHKVDAVILDYNMPDMNGERVAIELRRLNPNVPILLFSAYPDAIPRALFSAIDAFVAKGQHPMVLLDVLGQLLLSTAKKGPDTAGESGIQSQVGD